MTWNEIRHLHRRPQVVALWRRLLGPLLPWLTPTRRRLALGLGAFAVALRLSIEAVEPGREWHEFQADPASWLPLALLMIAYVAVCYLVARRYSSLPLFVQRRPLVFLHGTFWILLVTLWNTRTENSLQRGILAAGAALMPFLLWRLCYLIQQAQRGRLAGSGFLDHALYVWPLWGGTDTPYGKGLDYLQSTEARDEESLARSQLAGLKLLVLALAWSAGHRLISGGVFGADNAFRRLLGSAALDLPGIAEILRSVPGTHPVWSGWIAIYGDLFVQVLKLAAFGHVVIGYVRLCGFNVFRNTYKPLLAESIVGFWNRYYYYFKELLVHFFFIPTFVSRFKRHPRLRLFAAVFASACVGNVYYHLIQHESLLNQDWVALGEMLVPRASYCVLLAAGIYVSMLREQGRSVARADRLWPRRAIAIFGVWTFYGLLQLFHDGRATLRTRLDHLLALAGMT